MKKILTMLGAGILLHAALAAAQSCPVDTLHVSDLYSSSAPGLVFVGDDPVQMVARTNPSLLASYNLSARRATASARLYSPYNSGPPFGNARVAAHDRFTLSGPATAVPVSFHARLRVHKQSGGYQPYPCRDEMCAVPSGAVTAAFSAGGQSAARWSRMQDGADSTELVVPLSVVSGQSFEVAVELTANADFAGNVWLDQDSRRTAEITGEWDFPDLPSGFSLVSCQGAQAWESIPVRANAGSFSEPVVTSDGQRGAFVAWSEARGSVARIYAQHLSERGARLWETDGILLGSGGGSQWRPKIVPDGEGGAIISWFDFDGPASGLIGAQRVNAAGERMWPAEGLVVSLMGPIQAEPTARLVADGQGGAITTWVDWRTGTQRVYAQRVANSGVIRWTAGGLPVCEVEGAPQMSPDLVPDGAGGAIISWGEARQTSSTHLFVQRIDGSGSRVWPSAGVDAGELGAFARERGIVPDGSGGAYLGWSGAYGGTRLAHVAANGSLPWGSQPLAPGTGDVKTLVESGSRGFLVVTAPVGGANDVVRLVDPSGSPVWSMNDLAMVDWAVSCADGAGGLVRAFEVPGWESREPGISHLTAEGVRRWPISGLMLNNLTTDPSSYALAPGMPGEVLVAWQEGNDVRASRVPLVPQVTSGPVPTLVELFRLEDSAEGVLVHWSAADGAFAEPLAAQRAVSEAGEWVAIDGDVRVEDGVRTQLDREAATGMPTWYRLTGTLAGGAAFTAPALKIVHAGVAGGVALEPLAPNPARSSALVTYALPRAARASLTLHDVQGREVMRHEVAFATEGRHVAALDVSDLRAGLYFVRLRVGGEERVRRIIVVH